MRNQLPSRKSSLIGFDVDDGSSSIKGNSAAIEPSCILAVNDSDGDDDDDVVGGLKVDAILPLSTFEQVIGSPSKRVAESSLEIGIDVGAAAAIALDVEGSSCGKPFCCMGRIKCFEIDCTLKMIIS